MALSWCRWSPRKVIRSKGYRRRPAGYHPCPDALERRDLPRFIAATRYRVGSEPLALAVADFNGDGRADTAVGSSETDNVYAVLGNGDGTFQPGHSYDVLNGYPSPTRAAGALTVTALDSFGNVATGYVGTVTLRSSDTQAGLPAGYTFTAADAGVHTFTATLKTAGTQSLTVRDAAARR